MQTTDPLTEKDIARLFNDRGLRNTRQRQSLYLALASTTLHPTADELFHVIHAREANMSLATVYNTLETFCNTGLAQKLSGSGASARYDAAVHDHAHVRDTQSGKVRDVPHDLSGALLEHLPAEIVRRIEADMGFKVHQIQVELLGEFEDQA